MQIAPVFLSILRGRAFAEDPVFNGSQGGIKEGLDAAQGHVGLTNTGNARDAVVAIVGRVLDYVALAAVIVIIIAGFMLIVGMGSEDSRDRAKRMILYTIIGLILIILSRVIVMTVTGTVTTIF